MAKDADKGRTLYDFLTVILRQFGPIKIFLTILGVFMTGWLIAHYNAECGTRVLVWRLLDYEKGSCDPEVINSNTVEDGEMDEPEPENPEPTNIDVLARWSNSDNCYYRGNVISTSGNESRVIFQGFDDVKEIEAERIISILQAVESQELRTDNSIFVEFDMSRPTWVPATVLRINGNQVHAKLDTDIAKTCGIHRQSVSVTLDKIILAAPR